MKVFCLLAVVGIACAAPERGKLKQQFFENRHFLFLFFAVYVAFVVFIKLANTTLCMQK